MKNIFSIGIVAICLAMTSCYEPESETQKGSSQKEKVPSANFIRIKGSTTMLPLIDKITTFYKTGNKNYDFIINASGSNEGIQSLLKDSTDVAMSSNHISPKVKASFRKINAEYVEFLLAGDALVFVVNTNNKVQKLSKEDIEDIFTGKIANWKELGGDDLPIIVLSRDTSSGTYSFMKETVLPNHNLGKKTVYVRSNEEMMEKLAANPAAISYTSFSSLNYSVEPIDVSFDGGTSYVSPRAETVNNMKYKYFRGLYLYYKPGNYEKIKSFMQLVKSDTIQKMIKKSGYIPINNTLMSNQ